MLLYEEVSNRIDEMIRKGTYRAGERIPSIRCLSRQMRVSVNTVMEAYAGLENRGMIEARPQSGYYVCANLSKAEQRQAVVQQAGKIAPHAVVLGDVALQVMSCIANPSLVPLGGGIPNIDLTPVDKLNRMLASEARRSPQLSISYPPPQGHKRLRTQIAKRSLSAGCTLSADDIVVTSGCVEAMNLALQAVCRPGDAVAIGSPVYPTFLKSIQWMGLKVLEIPSSDEGMHLDVLAYVIKHNPVRACITIANFNNPLGGLMPDAKKQELVRLLAQHDIPLIEDDVYGDLAHGPVRPPSTNEGMNLEVLDYAIRHNRVSACITIANFNNPLGGLMPEARKRELVSLLAKHEIPLIEDDVYGDLAYGPSRPPATKAFDEKGLVLYCSSFSKTLAPGYRVGWIAPGRYQEKVMQLKALLNIGTPSPTQLAIAEFLTNGGYDHHLRKIRRVYARQTTQAREAVIRLLPPGTRVTRPAGGYILWVEMPEGFDAFTLYEAAVQEGIGIAPGAIFTLGDRYRNCFRLSAAFWSERCEQAVEMLGGLAETLR